MNMQGTLRSHRRPRTADSSGMEGHAGHRQIVLKVTSTASVQGAVDREHGPAGLGRRQRLDDGARRVERGVPAPRQLSVGLRA